ncbi:MAG: hypothetical protein HZA04_04855 [Nitrospinae bacterium]|nr:hypothetical protein [Nitrospinota bacterium]
MKRHERLPLFCKKCANVRETIFSGEQYCKLQCKYNPAHRISAWRSFYKKKQGVAA